MNKIDKIRKIVKETHDELDFKYHILPVVKNALLLAEKINADKEVVEVSALLHDIGRAFKIKDLTPENNVDKHHIIGAEKTKKILTELGYDNKFIHKVEQCILTHRGSTKPNPKTKEEKILSSADAMAHFDAFLSLFFVYTKVSNSFEDFINKMDAKIQRSWNKLMPEAKEIVKNKYDAINLLIKSMREYT